MSGISVHVVAAHVGDCGVTLAQVTTAVKSNEITAIPELLDLINGQGAIVTLDATGCQTKIVEKTVAGGGDYVTCLKGNQESLHEAIKSDFSETSMAGYRNAPTWLSRMVVDSLVLQVEKTSPLSEW